MKKILYITANPQIEEKSYSKRAGKYYLQQLEKFYDVEVTKIDVYEIPVPLIDKDVLSAWALLKSGHDFKDLNKSQQEKINQMNFNVNQFVEADEYVIVTPVWNLSIPPMLKAYIDNVNIVKKTFKYTEAGAVGLLTDKKATIIQAAGSVLSEGPLFESNFANRYLKRIFEFMGVKDINQITIEGVAIPGVSDEFRFKKVYQQIDTLLGVNSKK